jgi:hypothetical protein
MLNIAVVAPMLTASVITMAVANPGVRRSERRAAIGRMLFGTLNQWITLIGPCSKVDSMCVAA